MKNGAGVLSVLLLAASSPVQADDEACFRAAVEGQKLERSGKLLEARERFVACAQRSCDAAAVVDKCAGWLQGVEAALPSLTIAVKDADGRDVLAQRARVDEADAGAALGGRSIPVDPGIHRVVVEVSGVSLTESVVMRQGEKDRAVVFHVPAAAHGAERTPDGSTGRAPLVGAIVSGGVAVVSTALFAYFGARGLSARADYGCAVGCSADHFQTVHQDFVAADVTLGLAVASVVVGAVLLAVKPSTPRAAALLHPRPGLGFAF
jgi:hypothetical protein